MLPWFCDTDRDHRHLSEWEAANCSALYERFLEALAHLMTYVREDEVTMQVNTVLPDDPDGWDEE